MGCIYLARNKINGKCYVGQTVNSLEHRRQGHVQDAAFSNLPFHRALHKYGSDAFSWKVLMHCEDQNDLNESEAVCIALLKTRVPNGYNLLAGGGAYGHHHDTTKAKIASTLTGHAVTQEVRNKLRAANLGRKNPEHSKRMSGRKQTHESNVKRSNTLAGRRKSDEARANMSEACKKKTAEAVAASSSGLRKFNKRRAEQGISEDVRRKLIESHTGKSHSDETRAKMKEAQRRRRDREAGCTLPT